MMLMAVLSCAKEEESEPFILPAELNDTSSQSEQEDNLLREVSEIVGRALADPDAREEVIARMREADSLEELVTLSYLLDMEEGLNRRELSALKAGKLHLKAGQNRFREALLEELGRDLEQYPVLSGILEGKDAGMTSAKPGGNRPQAFLEALAGERLEIYHPFEGPHQTARARRSVYVSYRPAAFRESNEAFEITSGSPVLIPSGPIDNDFVDRNDVYIVGRMDDCDRPYSRCDYVDLKPDERVRTPEPIEAEPKLLTYNADHSTMEEEDIISTRLAGFRIRGKDWLGFGATHQKLVIFRGSPDGKISVEDGRIRAASNSYRIGYFRIRAKGVKKGWWYHQNEEFDDDWNMSESEQAITVFTRHHLTGSATVELNTKAGLKLSGGKIKPVAEATVGSRVKITLGSARQRSKSQLSRRQVLSSIVGPGVTGATVNRDGVDWNVKKSGIFQYYFKHYYTDL